jgi:hypothetical protein
MQNTFFLIGHIIAISLLVWYAYRVKVSGFKSYFHEYIHEITKALGREKSIFYKINCYFEIVFGVLAPIILFAYPKYLHRYPIDFETSEYFLLSVIALIIYIAAILSGFRFLIHILYKIWKSRKYKKKNN